MKAHSFAVRAGGRTVRGWYGLLPDLPPPSVEAGVRLYHRLLAPNVRRLTRESGTLASP